MGTLYIIATPIGNLQDVTERMLETMRNVDFLFCEDTRVTGKLLHRFEIKTTYQSYREDNHAQALPRILELLREGKNLGLVSDAGTPGVSDPGARLVRDILAAEPETSIIPIPGPSAVAAAISIAGFPADGFLFLGFPPHKGRVSFWKEALEYTRPVVLYESPHRITKALEELIELAPTRKLCVSRELTKLHETTYRGTPAEVKTALEKGSAKGEYVIVIAGEK